MTTDNQIGELSFRGVATGRGTWFALRGLTIAWQREFGMDRTGPGDGSTTNQDIRSRSPCTLVSTCRSGRKGLNGRNRDGAMAMLEERNWQDALLRDDIRRVPRQRENSQATLDPAADDLVVSGVEFVGISQSGQLTRTANLRVSRQRADGHLTQPRVNN